MASSLPSLQTATSTDIPPPTASKERSDNAACQSLEFPEGGTAAWCTVMGGMLLQFCGFGYTVSFGVYQDYYTQHYLSSYSPSTISWIGSVNAFMLTSCGLISGALFDRGYIYHLLIWGSLLQSFTLFMLSLAQPGQYYQIFLAQGIGLGIAQGMLFVPSLAVVSHYFKRRRTLAMSLVTSGSSLGSVINPIMLNNMFNSKVGFANGVRISAAFISVLLIFACLLIRTRLPPPENPASYLSVGKGIFRDLPFCIMWLGLLCVNIGIFFPTFFFQLDSVKHGNSETFSFYSLVLLNGASLVGRLAAGFIALYTGVPRQMIVTTIGCGVLMLGMIGLNGVASFVVIGIFFGYFFGAYIALSAPLIACLTNNLGEIGARVGFGMAALGLGGLIGGPVSGALLTSDYKWWQPSLFAGLIALVGALLLILMQLLRAHRKLVPSKLETGESVTHGA